MVVAQPARSLSRSRDGARDRGDRTVQPAAAVRAGAGAAVAPAPAPTAAPAAVDGVVLEHERRGSGDRQRRGAGAAVRQREAAADARLGDTAIPARRQPDRGRVPARRLPLPISRL